MKLFLAHDLEGSSEPTRLVGRIGVEQVVDRSRRTGAPCISLAETEPFSHGQVEHLDVREANVASLLQDDRDPCPDSGPRLFSGAWSPARLQIEDSGEIDVAREQENRLGPEHVRPVALEPTVGVHVLVRVASPSMEP